MREGWGRGWFWSPPPPPRPQYKIWRLENVSWLQTRPATLNKSPSVCTDQEVRPYQRRTYEVLIIIHTGCGAVSSSQEGGQLAPQAGRPCMELVGWVLGGRRSRTQFHQLTQSWLSLQGLTLSKLARGPDWSPEFPRFMLKKEGQSIHTTDKLPFAVRGTSAWREVPWFVS